MENIWAPRVLSRFYPTGLVEAYNLRLFSPDGQKAAWISYSFLKCHPVYGAQGRCRMVLFDRNTAPAANAETSAWDLAQCRITADLTEIRIGDNLLAPGIATGVLPSGYSWRIHWNPTQDALLVMPKALYGDASPLARTATPYTRPTASGALSAGDQTWDLDGWALTLDHSWGKRHESHLSRAQLRCETAYGECFVEALTIQRLHGLSLTAGALVLGSRTLTFTSPRSLWHNKASAGDDSLQLQLQNSTHTLSATLSFGPEDAAGLRYVQPDGSVVWSRCSLLAKGQLTLAPRFPGSSDLHLHIESPRSVSLESVRDAWLPGSRILA